MIENNNSEDAKRFARPAPRMRSHHWRKSGDRFEKANYSYRIDGEKSSNVQNDNTHPGLIPIDGCCTSQATQLLNKRWANAMHLYNDPSIDLSGALCKSHCINKPTSVLYLAQLFPPMHELKSS
uniref:Uncharacterized protein LOC105038587 isoform X2 n=1 Tax=Elaeis guineensis var. tenera TaxID=51953 RepID=A0A6J0PG32_ELAGV|nr:uncharacterized protein LOC105038587 isoform X2 [Elaeis guineensis]